MRTVAVIPAYNEESRIGGVIEEVKDFVDRVIVVDDGSGDRTGEVAEEYGADVVRHETNSGYLKALKSGFRNSDEEVIVTLDADGEMDPSYIPELVEPIRKGEASLVLGVRKRVPRVSERFLSALSGLKVDVSDTGTGFRAIRGELARTLELHGVCPCGTFVLEAEKLGAGIAEVPVETREVEKPKRVAWKHFIQFWHVSKLLLF
ncbi:hypothetical protein AKJ37_06070 [candidate division MSBL1 archaeon SCGC-AAA259I09]|uniref:Glycosyltransferase 2-like domain-containing protein n=2 Tax=candidate division MSBL1 TaxID=215777 RepID=A0A133UPK9_9EURY|nr:hypothetical protein AKJ37_06070 [candidate division MSBL1 archaeon SCGC-AAA259I09]KXA97142.1 hypothetical protein AKJ39_03635 [candidate division MSBL1 archaeon SCGC-AAA259J03]